MTKHGMLIRLQEDAFGSVIMTPVSKVWQKKIRLFLASWGETWDGSAYVQSDTEATYGDLYLSRTQINDLKHGWPVTIKMDPWVFGQGYIGYDAGDRNYKALT